MDIRTAKTTLDYPLYVCDFDPADPGRLLVGGGGGASRTGVGNKLTLLDTSRPESVELPTLAEIQLPKDEDSATSLALGPRRGRTTIAFAGVNASLDALRKGRNDHFRVFGIDAPSSSPARMAELARASLFASSPAAPAPDVDTYQRLVRLSAPVPDGQGSTLPQLGACATGFSKAASQIVLFDVTAAAPAAAAAASAAAKTTAAAVLPRVRGRLELSREAADLDVVQTGPDQFQLAYCTDHELFLLNVGATGVPAAAAAAASNAPYLAYEITTDEATGRTTRPTFRALRYVTPRFVLAVCNLPKRTGAFLLGLRLPDVPAAPGAGAGAGPGAELPRARIAVNVSLPRSAITQATGLAVCNLAPPLAPGAPQADGTQFVVAVAGAGRAGDNSLALYTLLYQTVGGGGGGVAGTDLLGQLHPFRTLRGVHELPMTSIALSHFPGGAAAASSSSSSGGGGGAGAPSPYYLRLASVSVQNTVVVHAIPLRRLPPPKASKASKAPKAVVSSRHPPRYVVALKSQPPSGAPFAVAVAVSMVLIALAAQALMEVLGLTQPLLGARDVVPLSWLSPLPARYAAGDRLLTATAAEAAAAAAVAATAGDPRVVPDVDVPVPVVASSTTVPDSEPTPLDDEPALHPVAALLARGGGGAVDNADGGDGRRPVLVLRDEGTATPAAATPDIAVVPHDEAAHGPAVPWEALGAAQQAAWRERLQQAGHWGEEMGETVLRGVLFSELAGVVGAMLG